MSINAIINWAVMWFDPDAAIGPDEAEGLLADLHPGGLPSRPRQWQPSRCG
jgi:hypothetical protein